MTPGRTVNQIIYRKIKKLVSGFIAMRSKRKVMPNKFVGHSNGVAKGRNIMSESIKISQNKKFYFILCFHCFLQFD